MFFYQNDELEDNKVDFGVTISFSDTRTPTHTHTHLSCRRLYKSKLLCVFFVVFFLQVIRSLPTIQAVPLFRGSVKQQKKTWPLLRRFFVRQAVHLPPPCLFGGNASPKEVAFAHILRARAVCQMEEALWIHGMDGLGWVVSASLGSASFFGQGS